jgi:hypothetical protein
MLTKEHRRGYARDEMDDSNWARVGKFLKSRLSPEDFEQLKNFLQANPEEKPGSDDEEREPKEKRADDARRRLASDSTPRSSFESVWARIKVMN